MASFNVSILFKTPPILFVIKNQTVEFLPNNEDYIRYYKDAMVKHKTQMLGINMQSNPQGIGVVDGVDIKQHLVRVH